MIELGIIKRDLETVLNFIDGQTFYHEIAHELLRVNELKICAEFICESIGDNAVVLTAEIKTLVLNCSTSLDLGEDFLKVVNLAKVR